jgi:hypothetical protein
MRVIDYSCGGPYAVVRDSVGWGVNLVIDRER